MQHPEDPLKFAQKSSSEDIVSYLRVLDHSYHTKGASPISDSFYDTIKDTFKERFPDHPYLNEVGSSFFSTKNKVVLPYYMGSIDKIKADGPTLNRFIKNYSGEYLVSDKLDGISALYIVKPDKSEKLYTRGNGYEGQDITSFLPHLSFSSASASSLDIRKKIREESKQTEKDIVMRGELIMTKEHFQHVKDKGANARNLVAGIMNSKTPDKKILSLIDFVPYTLIEPRIKPSQAVEWWQMRQIIPVHTAKISASELNADYLTGLLAERRRDSPYEIDGIVIIHDAYHPIVKGENPSYAFAFKSMVQENVAEVVVKDVEWNISRNGKMVPVILFDPVSLNGVVIKRTTGFNAQYIDKNVIGPGSRILITRSGDVIPFIVEVLTPSSSGQPMMPTDVSYKWNNTKVDIFVENIGENKEVAVKNLIHFFTKVKVFGFSESNVRKMYENGFKTAEDILFASKKDFQKVIGQTNGEKICHQMVKICDNIDFVTLMEASNSLGHGFGAKKIKLIVDHIPNIATDACYVPTVGELVDIDGISDITAEQFISGLRTFHRFLASNPRLAGCISVSKQKTGKTGKTEKNEVKKEKENGKKKEKKDMENRVVLFTGFRDGDLVKEIESRGGKMAGSMSKKITDLVYKTYSDTSAKIKQAKEWGNIRLISYDDFKRNIED